MITVEQFNENYMAFRKRMPTAAEVVAHYQRLISRGGREYAGESNTTRWAAMAKKTKYAKAKETRGRHEEGTKRNMPS